MSSLVLAADGAVPLIVISLYFFLGGKQWKQIYFVTMIFPVLAFLISFFVPESPRYLYAKKKFRELNKTLKYISRVNGVKLDLDNDVRALLNQSLKSDVSVVTIEKMDQKEYTVFNDLKNSKTLINFLITI